MFHSVSRAWYLCGLAGYYEWSVGYPIYVAIPTSTLSCYPPSRVESAMVSLNHLAQLDLGAIKALFGNQLGSTREPQLSPRDEFTTVRDSSGIPPHFMLRQCMRPVRFASIISWAKHRVTLVLWLTVWEPIAKFDQHDLNCRTCPKLKSYPRFPNAVRATRVARTPIEKKNLARIVLTWCNFPIRAQNASTSVLNIFGMEVINHPPSPNHFQTCPMLANLETPIVNTCISGYDGHFCKSGERI